MQTIKFKSGALVIDKSIVLVEIFANPHCKRCQKAKILVESIVREIANKNLHWREVNVIEEIDYTIHLGIVATPAIAINGQREFTNLPSKEKLHNLIQQKLKNI